MREAPRARASVQASRPMAPTPKTRTVFGVDEEESFEGDDDDDEKPTRRAAWMSTESGSASAASSRETFSGILRGAK